MKRVTLQWISLTATAAVLAAGCAAGPQQAPNRNNTGNNLSTTTGDADACAVALGNTVAGGGTITAPAAGHPTTNEVTANGVILGNVALVALPTADNIPLTQSTTPASPINPVFPGTNGMAPGMTSAAGTTDAAAGTTGDTTPGAAGASTTTNGVTTGTKGTPATINGTTGTNGTNGTTGTDGTLGGATPGATTGSTPGSLAGDANAIDRIKVACDKLVDIRVVNEASDRVRLAQIAAAIRTGQPITNFMTDLTRMTQAATSVGGGRNANNGAGGANAVPGTPAGTAPGTTGTGTGTTTPGTTGTPTTTTPVTPGLP